MLSTGLHFASESTGPVMCDYSLEMYGSRPAGEGELLQEGASRQALRSDF
jgi:hypothetical protein